MTTIDLTPGGGLATPLVGMVTRFPPSHSASAWAARELSVRLSASHGFAVEVIRLMGHGEAAAAGHPVVMDVNPRGRMSARLAAERAERCDLVLVSIDRHVPLELVEELVAAVAAPFVLVIDDVGDPGSDDLLACAALARRVAACIVHSEEAASRLRAAADPDGLDIRVIPHGSPWPALPVSDRSRRTILSWGFMAPGMGAEQVVDALALLTDLTPLPRYRLIGVTDPGWSRKEAAAYRASLALLAERRGVRHQLEMVAVHHGVDALQREIERSDVIAVVYDSIHLASSRILTEAVSTGRPVVATEFPGAVELLASGAGSTVPHDDPPALADALRALLTDDEVYEKASEAAHSAAAAFGWDAIAARIADVLSEQLGNRRLPSGAGL